MFICREIKRYKELWGVEDRTRSGRLRSVRAVAAIKTVRERIRRNPLWKQKIMSQKLNISTLFRDDLHMRAPLRSKGHLLTAALKAVRWTRAKRLLQWHVGNGCKNILFTDEKIYIIDEQPKNQNNKIYAQKLTLPTSWFGRECPISG